MAKKPELSKPQAVAEYLKANPQAKPAEIVDAMAKKGITITRGHAANIKSKIKNGKKKTRSPVTEVVATATEKPTVAPATKEPVTLNETITLEQIRMVAQTIKAVGGDVKLHGLLTVIQEVGGLERFKDLLAAMSATTTDTVPF